MSANQKKQEVMVPEALPVVVNEYTRMIELAINQNADIEKLEKLVDLQERWERNQSHKKFCEATADFQSNMPTIIKSKTASFQTKSGWMEYTYASIDDIVKAISPVLGKHRLSYRFEQVVINGLITVTCILTHASGHSESCAMSGLPDTSGNKNPMQQLASAFSYLKKYTLSGVLGLAAVDDDNDGHYDQLSPSDQPQTIEHQASDACSISYFNQMLPQWKNQILQEGKTPERVIEFLQRKGVNLSPQQQQQIQQVAQ